MSVCDGVKTKVGEGLKLFEELYVQVDTYHGYVSSQLVFSVAIDVIIRKRRRDE